MQPTISTEISIVNEKVVKLVVDALNKKILTHNFYYIEDNNNVWKSIYCNGIASKAKQNYFRTFIHGILAGIEVAREGIR